MSEKTMTLVIVVLMNVLELVNVIFGPGWWDLVTERYIAITISILMPILAWFVPQFAKEYQS